MKENSITFKDFPGGVETTKSHLLRLFSAVHCSR